MAKKFIMTVMLVTFTVIGMIFSAASAFAECGPGFSNKQQLISYYKHNPAAAAGFRKELLAHAKYTGYQADETVVDYLKSSEQRVFTAPGGYKLKSNTFCPLGAGQYRPYGGLLNNMSGRAMLWHCVKGVNCVPLLKGYCMNFVTGPPVHKQHPPKKRRHKKKTVQRKKATPMAQCQGSIVVIAGQAVCQSQSNSNSTSQSGTTSGQGSPVINVNVTQQQNNQQNQGQQQGQTQEEKSCSCEEKAAPPPSPSIKNLTEIQEVDVNEVRPEVCADVNIPSGSGTVVFSAIRGSFTNGTFTVSGFAHLCATYTAPSEEGSDTITVTVYVNGQEPVALSEPVKVNPQPTTRP